MSHLARYIKFLRGQLNIKASIKIVCDASNGTVGPVLRGVFDSFKGVELILINDEISGDFPAHGPNPKTKGAANELSAKVLQEGADLGAIFDGDADRVLFVDGRGQSIDAFDVLVLLKDSFRPPYIVDVRALADFTLPDLPTVEVRAGRYYVSKAVEEQNAELGVERSGHFFFKDFGYRDSAVLATIHLINAVSLLKKEGNSIQQLLEQANKIRRPPELDFQLEDREGALRRVEEHYGALGSAKIHKLDGISVFGGDFAFNLRSSNTEPAIRLNIAASSKRVLDEKLTEIKKLMEVVDGG